MRRLFAFATGAAVLFLGACREDSQPIAPGDPIATPLLAPAFSLQQQVERVVPGRVLVRVISDADPTEVGQGHGVALERMGAGGAYAVFRGPAGSERALAARLRDDARVEWAEPDYLREPTEIDPRLWAFYNPGDLFVSFTRGQNKNSPVTSYLSVADADEDNELGYASGGNPVKIASIDTGVDFGHPEFPGGTQGATLVAGWDFYDNDGDPSDTDDHGTHTTGTMVGRTVGVAGVAGAAPNVTVYVYRVCGPLGCPSSAIADAIRAAANVGVVAMNLSLGGGSLSSAEAGAIDYATNNLRDKTTSSLVIASAGNGGTGTVSCPACDPNAISVAASNWRDELAYYSNWGPGLDLTAPGGELYSNTTSEAGIWSSIRGGGYTYYQGTSMAAPQVTGTAAVVASVTGKNGVDLRAALEGSADDLGAGGYDTRFGNGRLNSYRAVQGTDLDGGNPPPGDVLAAAFTYSCSGLTCSFDARSSTGASGWDWDFGDGDSASGDRTTHLFALGSWTVTLTVRDATDTFHDSTDTIIQCSQRGKTVRCR